jgi:catechol-2,3-dioxygenase
MIKVKRLGHATIATPDIEAMVDYYGRLLGLSVIERSKERVFLGSKQGLEAIELVKGQPNDLKRVSFQIAPGTDLGDVVKELGGMGIKAERRKDVSPGVAEAVTLEDPKGTPIDLYAE